MVDQTGLSVADLVRGCACHEAAFAPPGFTVRLCLGEKVATVGAVNDVQASNDPGDDFWISCREPQRPRVHVAFRAVSHAEVQAFHAVGLADGGTDHGVPSHHADYHAAFVIDRDGDNMDAVCHERIAA